MPVETPEQARALPTVSKDFLTNIRKAQATETTTPIPKVEPIADGKTPTPLEQPPKEQITSPAQQLESKNPPALEPLKGDPTEGFKKSNEGDRETNLANLRKAREESETRAKAAEARAKELEGKIPPDYEQLKKDRDLLIREIEMRDITASPRFKEKYDKPLEQQLGQISKTLKTAKLTDVKPEDFTVVVQMPESAERTAKLDELIEGLDRISGGKVLNAISEYDRVRDARAQEVDNPSEAWQAAQRDREQSEIVRLEDNKKSMASALAAAEKNIPWFKEIPENEAWNQKINSVKSRAWNFWEGKHSNDELSQLTLAGSMAPMLVEALTLAGHENDRLNAELSELRGSKPRTNAGSGAGAGTGTGAKAGEKLTIAQVFRRGATGQS